MCGGYHVRQAVVPLTEVEAYPKLPKLHKCCQRHEEIADRYDEPLVSLPIIVSREETCRFANIFGKIRLIGSGSDD